IQPFAPQGPTAIKYAGPESRQVNFDHDHYSSAQIIGRVASPPPNLRKTSIRAAGLPESHSRAYAVGIKVAANGRQPNCTMETVDSLTAQRRTQRKTAAQPEDHAASAVRAEGSAARPRDASSRPARHHNIAVAGQTERPLPPAQPRRLVGTEQQSHSLPLVHLLLGLLCSGVGSIDDHGQIVAVLFGEQKDSVHPLAVVVVGVLAVAIGVDRSARAVGERAEAKERVWKTHFLILL